MYSIYAYWAAAYEDIVRGSKGFSGESVMHMQQPSM